MIDLLGGGGEQRSRIEHFVQVPLGAKLEEVISAETQQQYS